MAKRRFFEEDEDPRKNPDICPEVAESWIRSKNYGVNPFDIKSQKAPDENVIKKAFHDNKLLIQTAVPFIKKFMPFLTISDYILGLTDRYGTVLYNAGNENAFKYINQRKRSIKFLSAGEEFIGTNANILSIIHKIPVQLIGPNNYLVIHEHHIASAAPILNSNGEVIGSLSVMQDYGDLNNSQKIYAHTLGWVTSMAEAITKQYEIQRKTLQLETAYKTLEKSLSVAEQGFVTLDGNGMITHISKKAMEMLGITDTHAINQHYTKYFGVDASIRDALLNGYNVHDLELSVGYDSHDKKYLISIDHIWDDKKVSRQGAVIYMTKVSRMDKIIAKRGGTKAYFAFDDIIGESEEIRRAISFAKQVALTNTNILLIGESGTGKELFAQAIHNSYCPDGPFVAVNCASMPRNLIESELFGYEGGAFTGADRKGRPGKFELANGGTLFLDEIGDMPIELQPVLLRVLEERQVMRIGGTKYIPVNVRIIAATNKDLLELIRKRQFREDLYYRLAVLKIEIPPLRQRGNDALILAKYFVETTCQKIGKKPPEIGADARKVISTYHWPGNIRQLENAIVHAVYMCNGKTITANDLPLEIICEEKSPENRRELLSIAELEKDAIIKAMRLTKKNNGKSCRNSWYRTNHSLQKIKGL